MKFLTGFINCKKMDSKSRTPMGGGGWRVNKMDDFPYVNLDLYDHVTIYDREKVSAHFTRHFNPFSKLQVFCSMTDRPTDQVN